MLAKLVIKSLLVEPGTETVDDVEDCIICWIQGSVVSGDKTHKYVEYVALTMKGFVRFPLPVGEKLEDTDKVFGMIIRPDQMTKYGHLGFRIRNFQHCTKWWHWIFSHDLAYVMRVWREYWQLRRQRFNAFHAMDLVRARYPEVRFLELWHNHPSKRGLLLHYRKLVRMQQWLWRLPGRLYNWLVPVRTYAVATHSDRTDVKFVTKLGLVRDRVKFRIRTWFSKARACIPGWARVRW